MLMRMVSMACLLAALLPLQAQVDPRLRTATDLLDVYKTSGAKPEVLTIFDFSTSMHAMYWHPAYYCNVSGTTHVTSAPNGRGWTNSLPRGDDGQSGIVPIIDRNGRVYLVDGDGPNGTPTITSFGTALNYMRNDGSGRLVRPDGTLVPLSGTYTQAQLTALVQQATHIRMTAVAGGVTRTVDLPIPWAIFDPVANGGVPSLTTIPDTLGGGPAITPDEAYLSNNPNHIVNNAPGGGATYHKVGLLRYNYDYLWWIFFGQDVKNAAGNGTVPLSPAAYAIGDAASKPAWSNGLPGLTRFQALKYAVVYTWLQNQFKVWWGFRYLDEAEQNRTTVSADNGSASSTAINRDIRLFRPAPNGSSADPKLKQFVQALPATSTPLTYAFANGYTQLALNKDASSSFGSSQGGGQSGTEYPIPACRQSFMVVFTDGVANDTRNSQGSSAIGTASDVYAQGNAAMGNTALGGLATALTPGTANRFNIWTLAAVSAHYPAGSYSSPTSLSANYAIGTAAPFLISDRGATPSNKRRVRTMTVGMSLFGNFSDAAGGKAALYRAALYGNPSIATWVDPTSANPTPAFDPNDPSRSDRTVNPFFFDAQSVDQLTAAMQAAITEAITASGSVSAPSAPLVGLSLGREAFLGLFQPAKSGPLWQGDLLAGGLLLSNTADTFLGNDGTPVTSVNAENAIWSAGDFLRSEGLTYNFQAAQYTDPTKITGTGPRSWKAGHRKVLTNLAGTALEDLDEGNANLTRAALGASSDAERTALLRFLRGAHASAESGPAATAPSIARTTIMGDIVSSSPAVLEYPLGLLSQSPVLSAVDTSQWKETHFRVIFVGDNQGYVHAFGEVGGVLVATDTSVSPPKVTKTPIAAVDELWAFYPGELLATLPAHLRNSSNPRVYGMDGVPVVYFHDKPPAGRVVGNGLVDGDDEVRVLIGMGKGGRNYYAFDVKDPFNPGLAWKLLPGASPDAVVQKMGLATSTPALARVDLGGTPTDAAFIGGGLSTRSVDAAMGGPLGRNLVAVSVLDGTVLRSWDFSGIANMGSLTAPVVPVEFLPNTGRAQRVYFTDQPVEPATLGTGSRGSAVWAVGGTALAANGVTRLDSSDLADWSGGPFASGGGLRRIYQGSPGLVISTSPVPFRLSSPYPVARTVPPLLSPAVLGLAVASGDRNDPLDRDLINPGSQNQVTVVFDRQDSAGLAGNAPAPVHAATLDAGGFVDADLYDLSGVTSPADTRLLPSHLDHYLKSKFGYKLLLGGSTAKAFADGGGPSYFPKASSAPSVLDGVLFLSLLRPGNLTDAGGNQVACSGTGQTGIYRLCNILAPVFAGGATLADTTTFNASSATCSGLTVTFANIPGPLTGLGSVGVLVSGQGKTSDGSSGSIATAGAQAEVVKGRNQNLGFRVRTWRIVR